MIETALAVVRILTGVLLTVSAYGKFRQDYGAGVSDVLGYRIVRRPVAEAIAFALPVVEMLLAACLVLGLLLPASEVVAGVLLALLAGAAGSVLSRGITTDCGCYGSILRARVGPPVIARNVVLCLVLLADALLGSGRRLVLAEPGWGFGLLGLAVCAALLVAQRLSQRRAHRRRGAAPTATGR